jgi:hypothetical protein
VFTLSLHGAKNFPFRKEAGDLDVDLPDGCGDDDYLARAGAGAGRTGRALRAPGLVIYLAGADPHEGDRLGRLKLTHDGLEARDRGCSTGPGSAACRWPDDGRWLRHDIADTVQVQFNTWRVAAAILARWQNRRLDESPARPSPARAAQRLQGLRPITTRWMDNDAYGHVNNVVYYSWFDTAVNAHLIEQGVLDIHQGETIGLVIETQCNYFRAAGVSADGGGRASGWRTGHVQRAL